jgi:peptidoglycan/LPS O-acetylase OafA/YrhL
VVREVEVGRSAPAAPAARFEELEAYRGVAALLIVVFHAYQFSKQGTGAARYVYEGKPLHALFHNLEAAVAWFFVLSGFLVFLPFARAAIDQKRPQSARGFLVRRAIRILPTYYVAILIVWTSRYTGFPGQWTDLAEHLTFTQIFDRRYTFWTIGPAWSLAVEVWFYVAVALIGPLLYRVCGRLRTAGACAWLLAAVVGLIGAASAGFKIWAYWVAKIPESNSPVYFGPLAKADGLAIGMLLVIAAAVLGGRRLAPAAAIAGALAGVAVMAASFLLRDRSEVVRVFFHTFNAVGFGLLLAATVIGPAGSVWARLLARPLFRWLGIFSYSIYLWHEPIMLWMGERGWLIQARPDAFPLNAAILCVLAVVAGAIGYWALEQPTMQLRHLFDRNGRLIDRYARPERPLASGAAGIGRRPE